MSVPPSLPIRGSTLAPLGRDQSVSDEAAHRPSGGGVREPRGVWVVRATAGCPPAQLHDEMGGRLWLLDPDRAGLAPPPQVSLVAGEQLAAHPAEDHGQLREVLHRPLDHVHPEPHPGEHVVQLTHDRLDFGLLAGDRKSTRLNSSHSSISYAVFCLKKKKKQKKLINDIKEKRKKSQQYHS